MQRPRINIVWFKRDLRLSDHLPLQQAIEAGLPILLLFCFEPSCMAHVDSSNRHWRFAWQGIEVLEQSLARMGIPLFWVHAEALETFQTLLQYAEIQSVYAYQETGNALSYARDQHMTAFFQKQRINWLEYPSGGVIRGLKHRNHWEQYWLSQMNAPLVHPDWAQLQVFVPPPDLLARLRAQPLPSQLYQNFPDFQPGGTHNAWRYLHSFLHSRHRQYFKQISKPAAARHSCSRISPYLTWGNISMRELWQATRHALNAGGDRYNLEQFGSRLFWHCHFIQKFESECRMEFENLNRGFDTLEKPVRPDWVQAWENGYTGFPLIDACMRCVNATGYLNFRMRAMLVSFLTHHLWQPWQQGVHHLARQFLDYEPGIHYPQFQMQAGTSGVNTIRIYNPVKQGQEHDPTGEFIRKWLPELAPLPTAHLHEPWKLSALEQKWLGWELGKQYPQPIVNLEQRATHAREVLWKWKKNESVKQENSRILKTHTKRKSENETLIMGNPAVQTGIFPAKKQK